MKSFLKILLNPAPVAVEFKITNKELVLIEDPIPSLSLYRFEWALDRTIWLPKISTITCQLPKDLLKFLGPATTTQVIDGHVHWVWWFNFNSHFIVLTSSCRWGTSLHTSCNWEQQKQLPCKELLATSIDSIINQFQLTSHWQEHYSFRYWLTPEVQLTKHNLTK